MVSVTRGGDVSGILEGSAHLPMVSVPSGTEILREGTSSGVLLVLVDGTVEVLRQGTLVMSIDEPGSILGETSALLGRAATATLRSASECRLRRCEDPHGFLAEHPEVALAVAVTLARRLDTITGYLADLKDQYADRSDHLGVVDTMLAGLAHHHGPAFEPGSEREPEAPY
jgi:CRP-like cAMP-binding protein